jgi:hypothetical protein
MKSTKSILLWVFAIVLSLLIGVFQRMTGPTHPVRGQDTVNGKSIQYRLLRSHTAFEDLPVAIKADTAEVKAFLVYKRYKTGDEWTEIEMERGGNHLEAKIPGQPVAGKVEYTIRIQINDQQVILNRGRSIVARFKGKVPSFFLIVHILLMLLGIIFALRTGMEALRKEGRYFGLVNWTLFIVFLGGIIFGPIVQKYAFGDFWTGFPFGFDLTDNKILLAFIFWVFAFFFKRKSKWWVLTAAILMIGVYLIPHSVLGSELDYETGKMNNKYSLYQKPPTRSVVPERTLVRYFRQ